MCKNWKLIKVQGEWFILLGMNGGMASLGSLWNINNCVVRRGIIWEMQPFCYQHEFWYGKILQSIVYKIRQIKNWWYQKKFVNCITF